MPDPATQDRKIDPIQFEVLRHKLDEIIAEAYYTMGRVSGSPVVYEVGDHQEAICTASGEAAVFGAGVLHWVQSIGAGVRHLLARYAENPGFEPGDQFLLNDPYIAAVHGQDLQVLAPLIWEGELIAWAGSASHQTDIGGADPGSLCISANEVFQEGFQTPGLKIVERGVVRRDVEETFANAVRTPALGLLDIRAKIASNNVMKTRLIELLERYGADAIRTFFDQLIAYSEQRVRARLRSVPDGTWHSENYVEGIKEDHLKVSVAVTKREDTLLFDFEGSSPQSESSLNLGPVGTMSSAANPFIAMVCHDIPWNEGLLKPLEFELPERSIVNPQRPAAVSASVPTGANILTLTTCQNALAKMLLESDDLREDACGNSAAGHNTLVLAGQDENQRFFTTLILDAGAGGGGAFPDRDGIDSAVNQWTVKAMVTNVETVEMLYPVMYLWRSEVVDSGGPGTFRGGLGIAVGLVPWGTGQMIGINIGSGVRTRGCLGYAGGYPAAHTPVRVVRGADVGARFAMDELPHMPEELEGAVELLGAKASTMVGAGDVLYGYLGSGGGGFGDPLGREPQHVAADVAEGAVSPELARDAYGVVVGVEPDSLDLEATASTREALRRERIEAMTELSGASARECPSCGEAGAFGEWAEGISRHEPEGLHAPDESFGLRLIGCTRCGALLECTMGPSGS